LAYIFAKKVSIHVKSRPVKTKDPHSVLHFRPLQYSSKNAQFSR